MESPAFRLVLTTLSSVRDTMYLGVAGACAEQAANASTPLALSLTSPSDVTLNVPPGVNGATSTAGEITSVASASGGTTPYSYAWTLIEVTDATDEYAVSSQGTTTNATYNDATVKTTYNNPLPPTPPPPPPPPATFRVSCTVTDGNSDTVTATKDFSVSVV